MSSRLLFHGVALTRRATFGVLSQVLSQVLPELVFRLQKWLVGLFYDHQIEGYGLPSRRHQPYVPGRGGSGTRRR